MSRWSCSPMLYFVFSFSQNFCVKHFVNTICPETLKEKYYPFFSLFKSWERCSFEIFCELICNPFTVQVKLTAKARDKMCVHPEGSWNYPLNKEDSWNRQALFGGPVLLPIKMTGWQWVPMASAPLVPLSASLPGMQLLARFSFLTSLMMPSCLLEFLHCLSFLTQPPCTLKQLIWYKTFL